jgi:drug/metabolite transporter (DMT)-like permease
MSGGQEASPPLHCDSRQVLFGAVAAVLGGVCFGLYLPVQKHALAEVSPAFLNWAQVTAILAVSLPLHLAVNRRNPWPRPSEAGWLVCFGLTAAVLFYLRNVGVKLTGPTTGGVILSTEVLFSFVLSIVVFRSRVSARALVGAVLLAAGVLLAMRVSRGAMRLEPTGCILLLTTAFAVSVNAVNIKLHFNRVPNLLVVVGNTVCQSLLWTALLGGTGRLGEVHDLAHGWFGLEVLAGAALIGGNLFFYYYSMKRCPMWMCRSLTLVAPAVAMLGDRFMLGSHISAGQIAGLIAVTLGAVIIVHASRQNGGELVAVSGD